MRLRRPRRLLVVAVALAVLATACGDDASNAETADPDPDPAENGAGDDADGSVAAVGDCSAASAFEPDVDAVLCDPLDPDADPAEFAVTRISSTEREDVPSALDDARQDVFEPALIDLDRVLSGGPPPDGIPAIDEPLFQSAASVDWLAAGEAVLAFELGDEARAYPIQIMTWHELVNDTVADVPVTISYCPLCNSALAYDRRLGDRILDFGTSGRLYNSSMVMYDRQTESLWTHYDGTSVAGVLVGAELETFPISTISWEDFREIHPDGLVLTRNTGHRARDYGTNPYGGYDNAEGRPFLYDGEFDDRLPPKERVVVVRDDDEPAVSIPLVDLIAAGVIEFEAHGRRLVAVNDRGTASPLDHRQIAEGYDQGASNVFLAELDGVPLDLERTDDGFLDRTSGLTFDVLGGDVAGSDARLTPIEHLDTFWFAIAAFEPDVSIVGR
ncbi:MAG: hypothetical protein DHS20C19_04930 [Acidimicrobiales bacterium]|nr:MAG: hypothetical protein DHS20C19_04930 [Acidimicrobiales bacterium]